MFCDWICNNIYLTHPTGYSSITFAQYVHTQHSQWFPGLPCWEVAKGYIRLILTFWVKVCVVWCMFSQAKIYWIKLIGLSIIHYYLFMHVCSLTTIISSSSSLNLYVPSISALFTVMCMSLCKIFVLWWETRLVQHWDTRTTT